jgi:dipeptide/tripeptide permease
MAINFGAVCGPLLCGFLAQYYGWHYGFGVAAIFMLAGLATYLSGYRHLPAKVNRRQREQDAVRLSPADWRVIRVLIIVMLITIFQSVSYYQVANVFMIWVQQSVDLSVGNLTIPVAWYQSIDPLVSIIAVPLLFGLWQLQANRRGEPSELGKIGVGAWLAATANLILVVAITTSGGEAIHPSPVACTLLCRVGGGVSLLLANLVGTCVACRACQGKCDHDGHRVHVSVHIEQSDWLDRPLLRADEPDVVLDYACRDRCNRRFVDHAVWPPNRPSARSRGRTTDETVGDDARGGALASGLNASIRVNCQMDPFTRCRSVFQYRRAAQLR